MVLADDAFSKALGAQVSDTRLRAFAWLTHLGDEIVLRLLVVAVAQWLVSSRRFTLALGWVLALGGNALLNPLLKRIFERVRPCRLRHAGLPAAALRAACVAAAGTAGRGGAGLHRGGQSRVLAGALRQR